MLRTRQIDGDNRQLLRKAKWRLHPYFFCDLKYMNIIVIAVMCFRCPIKENLCMFNSLSPAQKCCFHNYVAIWYVTTAAENTTMNQ